MNGKEEVLANIQAKIANIGLSSKILVIEERGEVHISIHSSRMGKAHRNVRDSIKRRVKRAGSLHFYTIFLYLNPIHPGRACNTFILRAEEHCWDKLPTKMLPQEELVA